MFCFPCRFFGIAATEDSLMRIGFRDWKHARGKSGTLTFHHSICTKHHEAMLSWNAYKSTIANNSSVAVCIERGRLKTVEDNRVYVKAIVESILYLCQQGLPLRGHRESLDENDTVNIGNFRALMVLLSRNNETVKNRLTSGPKNASWLGHDIQNSIISLLADSVKAMIMNEVHSAQYYTLIADETKDVSKTEQLSLVLRYVYNCKTCERFVTYKKCDELISEALFRYIMNALREMDIDINNCVSQCYDGASVMSGCNTGVQTRVNDINPAAIYIHCHAHQLNLVLVDSCKKLDHASAFFSLLECVYVYMSSSVPHSVFINKQRQLGFTRLVQLKQLSDTRWSCRYTSIQAVTSTLPAIVSTLEELAEDSNTRSVQARGLLHQMKSFSFFLSLVLFEKIFGMTNNLSNLLQAEHLNYATAASCIKATKTTLSDLRSEEAWEKVWEKSLSLAEKFGIDDCPARPRRARRMPQRFDHADVIVDAAVVTPGETAIEDYRTHVYYATIDVLLEEMNNRFSELNLSLFTALDALLPTSTHFLDMSTLTPFLSHYSIGKTAVESEASLAKNFFSERRDSDPSSEADTLHEAYHLLSQVSECFPEIIKCYKIAMTIGVSSATAERSFSSLRRTKTYLRSTMGQTRLSDLALLTIERDLSSKLWDQVDELVLRFAETHKNSRIILS